MKDNISDMLTRISNGQKANLLEISLFWPTPNYCINILKLLQKEGYIRGFKKIILNNKKYIFVLLKYTSSQIPLIKRIERISMPGQRIFSKSQTLWKVNNGKGILIISSSKGFITDNEARFLNLGGEIICSIQ